MTSSVKESKSHKAVRLAIARIEKGRPNVISATRKMSVSAVVEEAGEGIYRATIYRDCDDLLTRIQGSIGKEVRQQRDAKQEELNKFKERNKELRSEVKEIKTINAYLQSKNATLILEVRRLENLKAKPDNVVPLR